MTELLNSKIALDILIGVCQFCLLLIPVFIKGKLYNRQPDSLRSGRTGFFSRAHQGLYWMAALTFLSIAALVRIDLISTNSVQLANKDKSDIMTAIKLIGYKYDKESKTLKADTAISKSSIFKFRGVEEHQHPELIATTRSVEVKDTTFKNGVFKCAVYVYNNGNTGAYKIKITAVVTDAQKSISFNPKSFEQYGPFIPKQGIAFDCVTNLQRPISYSDTVYVIAKFRYKDSLGRSYPSLLSISQYTKSFGFDCQWVVDPVKLKKLKRIADSI